MGILAADLPGNSPPKKPIKRERISAESITVGVILILKATSKRFKEYPLMNMLITQPIMPPHSAIMIDSMIREVRI